MLERIFSKTLVGEDNFLEILLGKDFKMKCSENLFERDFNQDLVRDDFKEKSCWRG